VGPEKYENFTNISAYKRPAGVYPLGDFLNKIFTVCGQHHRPIWLRITIRADLLRGFGVIGFEFKGVHITPNFQRPLAAKLFVGGAHVTAVQEKYGPPLSPYRGRLGTKKFDVFRLLFCLFVFVRHAYLLFPALPIPLLPLLSFTLPLPLSVKQWRYSHASGLAATMIDA